MTMRRALCVVAAGLWLAAGCNKDRDTANPDDVDVDEHDVEPDEAATPEYVDDDDRGDHVQEEAYLSMSLFEETVNANLQDVVDCYGNAKAANDALGDKLVATFHIDGEGKVTEISADKGSSIDDAAMLDCVRERAQGWGFLPPPDHEPTTMIFPFDFG